MRLVGLKGIAALAGVKQQTVRQWRLRKVLLEPFQYVDGLGPVWWDDDVKSWMKETGR